MPSAYCNLQRRPLLHLSWKLRLPFLSNYSDNFNLHLLCGLLSGSAGPLPAYCSRSGLSASQKFPCGQTSGALMHRGIFSNQISIRRALTNLQFQQRISSCPFVGCLQIYTIGPPPRTMQLIAMAPRTVDGLILPRGKTTMTTLLAASMRT